MSIIIASIYQGLLWSLMAIGVYLTFRILDIADMTAEGSFPLGGAICASCIVNGWSPIIATLFGFLGGMAAGFISGIMHTKLEIPALLTGILTMTGLYSINLFVMGKANISLLGGEKTIFTMTPVANENTAIFIVGGIVVAAVILLLVIFFNTEMGLAARAVGNNQNMAAANGVSVDNMKMIVYMISNGLIALCGALMVQMNGFADISMGIGTLVIALAAIIIAEILLKNITFGQRLLTIILGSIIYRLIIAFVLDRGVDPNALRLFYSLLLTIFLSFPFISKKIKQRQLRQKNRQEMEGK
ncbi:ABC transporter permease [Enterococcus timonensis]|uniref:ABC transporter permease n=1 Tax=Enterococcus timonensis TaxID=1852364 RepID=UPI0008DA24CC|nr:ABC transporter permease [Enterococcus timonensis]